MERTEIPATMVDLKLFGMKAGYDEIITTALKRQHEPQRIVGDLPRAEIAEKQARSIKYQITLSKLSRAKDIEDFRFEGTPFNEMLVRDLASGEFLAHQRNAVLVGGTGTGKTHLAIGIARACIRNGARGRYFNVVDLVNRLEAEAALAAMAAWPTTCRAWTSSCSTNSATCPLPSLAGNSSTISSAASTSRPPSS